MDLDTALLRTWQALAEEGHTGRAAQRLGITQQAVSKRLARLERTLGCALFERDGRRLRPTERGVELQGRATDILAMIDDLFERTRPELREVRVDVLDEYLAMTGPVADHAADSPLSISTVSRGDARSAVEVLRSGYADIAFGRAATFTGRRDGELAASAPVLEPIVLLLGARHRLASRRSVRLSEVSGAGLWFPMTGAPREWRMLVEDLGRAFGIRIDDTGSTMGMARFFERLAADDDRVSLYGSGMPSPPPSLRIVPITDPVPVFPWVASWRVGKDRLLRRTVETVIGSARRAIAEPDVADAWIPPDDRRALALPEDDSR